MSVSDQLLDLLTIRQLLLERVIAGENVAFNKQLDSVAEAITKALKGKELTEYQGKRLDKAVAELSDMVKLNSPELSAIAASEASFMQSAFASVGIKAVLPPAAAVEAIAKSSLTQGATISSWFGQLNETTRFNISRAVKNGVMLGLTNSQIAKSILGNGDKGSEPIAKSRRDGVAIIRTATQTVANDVRVAGYEENADIIKAVQWVATLDSRTSDICMARSGKSWTLPDFVPIGHSIPWNGGPPAHWACRSTSLPVTRSMAEITGKAADKIAPRTRASMNGAVPREMTFDQFLKGKPTAFADEMLGVGRADLWRSGKITLAQLLDQRGNPLTLAQLEARYGTAAKATKAATVAVPKIAALPAGDIDATIAAVKSFTQSDAIASAEKLLSIQLDKLGIARRAAFDSPVKNDELFAKAFKAEDVYYASAKSLNTLRIAEKARLLELVSLPQNMRGNAADVITGTVNLNYRKSVNAAAIIVSKLVHKDIMPVGVGVKGIRGNRAYFMEDRTIHINKNTSISVIVHEIVHDIEYSQPDVSAKTKAFLLKRANGEQTQSLQKLMGNKSYDQLEMTYVDEWKKRGGSHYMGKLYLRASTEILTMGVERILKDAKEFADNDPEYFRFMLEILRRVN